MIEMMGTVFRLVVTREISHDRANSSILIDGSITFVIVRIPLPLLTVRFIAVGKPDHLADEHEPVTGTELWSLGIVVVAEPRHVRVDIDIDSPSRRTIFLDSAPFSSPGTDERTRVIEFIVNDRDTISLCWRFREYRFILDPNRDRRY
ncbi:hypothetical protein [Haloplanus rubicundus]|uniref:Uncharacterized protein n=1 Tax=Haloplanus rubicundus TaxID=1547898 RepID=A0A345E8A3_9EURY|nr:hypothetical protein [Haloplanus rubicundus]AXG08425.1 hypothetical protein DU484_00380 [Haloplanus rubicundus]